MSSSAQYGLCQCRGVESIDGPRGERAGSGSRARQEELLRGRGRRVVHLLWTAGGVGERVSRVQVQSAVARRM